MKVVRVRSLLVALSCDVQFLQGCKGSRGLCTGSLGLELLLAVVSKLDPSTYYSCIACCDLGVPGSPLLVLVMLHLCYLCRGVRGSQRVCS